MSRSVIAALLFLREASAYAQNGPPAYFAGHPFEIKHDFDIIQRPDYTCSDQICTEFYPDCRESCAEWQQQCASDCVTRQTKSVDVCDTYPTESEQTCLEFAVLPYQECVRFEKMAVEECVAYERKTITSCQQYANKTVRSCSKFRLDCQEACTEWDFETVKYCTEYSILHYSIDADFSSDHRQGAVVLGASQPAGQYGYGEAYGQQDAIVVPDPTQEAPSPPECCSQTCKRFDLFSYPTKCKKYTKTCVPTMDCAEWTDIEYPSTECLQLRTRNVKGKCIELGTREYFTGSCLQWETKFYQTNNCTKWGELTYTLPNCVTKPVQFETDQCAESQLVCWNTDQCAQYQKMCGPGEKKCKTWATCEHNYGPMPSDVSLTSDALEAPVKTYAGGLVGSQVVPVENGPQYTDVYDRTYFLSSDGKFYNVEVLNDAGGYVFQPPADAPDATDHIDATVPLSHPQPTAVPGVSVVAVGAQGPAPDGKGLIWPVAASGRKLDDGVNDQIWPAPSKTTSSSSKHMADAGEKESKNVAGKKGKKKGKKGEGEGEGETAAANGTDTATPVETPPTGLPSDVGWSYDGEIPRQPWPLDTPRAPTETPTETTDAEETDKAEGKESGGKSNGTAEKDKGKKAEKAKPGKGGNGQSGDAAPAKLGGKKHADASDTKGTETDATGLKPNPGAKHTGAHQGNGGHHSHKQSSEGKDEGAESAAAGKSKSKEADAGKGAGKKAGKEKGKGKDGKGDGKLDKTTDAPAVTEVPVLNRTHFNGADTPVRVIGGGPQPAPAPLKQAAGRLLPESSAVFGFYNFAQGGGVVTLSDLTRTPDKFDETEGRFTGPKGTIGGFVAPDLTASGKGLGMDGDKEVTISEGSVQYHAVNGLEQDPVQNSPKGSIGGFVAPGTQAMGKDMGSQGSHSQHQQEFVEGSVRYFGTSNAPVAGDTPDSPKGAIGGFVMPGSEGMGKSMGGSQGEHVITEGSVHYVDTSAEPPKDSPKGAVGGFVMPGSEGVGKSMGGSQGEHVMTEGSVHYVGTSTGPPKDSPKGAIGGFVMPGSEGMGKSMGGNDQKQVVQEGSVRYVNGRRDQPGAVFGFYNFAEGGGVVMLDDMNGAPATASNTAGRVMGGPQGSIGAVMDPGTAAVGKANGGGHQQTYSEGSVRYTVPSPPIDSPKGSIGGFVAPGTNPAVGKAMGGHGSQHQQEFVEGSVRYVGTSSAPAADSPKGAIGGFVAPGSADTAVSEGSVQYHGSNGVKDQRKPSDYGQGKGSNSVAVGRDFTKGAGLQTVNTINQDYGGESSKGAFHRQGHGSSRQ